MESDLEKISEQLKWIGLGVLAEAQKNAFYHHFMISIDTSILSVLQTVHAAEFIIKACIAEVEPLAIFSEIPKDVKSNQFKLDFDSLFEEGRTLKFRELPKKLEQVRNYKIKDNERYYEFGRLRNGIQHFAVPDLDLTQLTGEFIYKIIDPIIGDFWNEYAVEYCNDEELEYNFLPTLVRREIDFRCPPKWKKYLIEAKEN